MKKYYFNDGTSQQGPFTIEELKGKNISPETPVWYEGLTEWTTAGKLEELKDIFVPTPPRFHATVPVEEVKPVTTATPAAAATATVTPVVTKTVSKPAKKSTAWLSYVLALLVLGAVGYLVYQDMEKNKGNTNSATTMMTTATVNTGNTGMQQPATDQPASTMASTGDTSKTGITPAVTTEAPTTNPATTTTTTVTTTATEPVPVTTTKPTAAKPTPVKPTAAEIKAKQAEAQKLAQKKAEEEKKKLQAAQAAQAALAAATAKEKEYRNNWPKYVTFGKLEYDTKGDGIAAFNVPVFNGTNAMIDKVTVRVDYMKKDKKVVKSETIFIYNIPPGAGLNGKAPESKKGNNVKVFITGISSRKLHFCFPANNGNPGDPYFCN